MPRFPPAFRPLLATVLSSTLSILPIQLLGASAVLARQDLHFDPADLGVAVAAFFTAYGVTAWTAGHLSQTRGPRIGLLIGTALSTISLLGIATVVQDWITMLAFVTIAGAGNAFSQVGGNLALTAGNGGMRRQGLAFGLKQSAVPVSSLLSGAAVPIIGVTIGWRWSFVAVLLLAPVLFALLARRFDDSSTVSTNASAPATNWLLMIPVALAYGGAAGAAAVLSTFLVESAVWSGVDVATAGAILAAGSVVSIVTRLGVGMLVDRRGKADLMIVAVMLFGGTLGYLALAQGSLAFFMFGTALAFGAGWGWNGAFNHLIVSMNRRNPGTASGLAMMGMAVGGVLWPLAFGLLATKVSFRAAWGATGMLCLASALVLMLIMSRVKAQLAAQ